MAAYYDEKQKTWYIKFRYTDWQGNSKSTSKRGFKTKKEALKYEQEAKESLKEAPKLSLKKFSEEYLQDYKNTNKRNSYVLTEKNIRKYILPYLADTQIDNITPIIIRKWQNELLQFNLSESTLCSINSTLNTMLNFAVKYYGLKSNPMKVTGKQGHYEKRLDFLELDEWKRLDECVDDLYSKVVFNILFWSGIRIGELMGLTKADIDLKNNTIDINKQYNRQHEVTTLKTKGSNRIISIPSFVIELIKDFYKASKYHQEEYIFTCYSSFHINGHLTAYCHKAGIKAISPHALRHSHASFLINNGVPINAISKRLGHANPSMTLNIYSHCYKDKDSDIAAMIENMFEKNVGQM
mgnify:CR=1 FL=1